MPGAGPGRPAHPGHEELRDRLGLRAGERVDPKASDPAAADAALDVLR